MNAPFKILAVGLLLGALGTGGVHQVRQSAARKVEMAEVERALAVARAEADRLREDRDATARQLDSSQAESGDLQRDIAELAILRERIAALEKEAAKRTVRPAVVDSKVSVWRDNVNLLKAKFDATPEAKIPELAFLDEYDWLSLARNEGRRWSRVSDNSWRSIMADARRDAKQVVATRLREALIQYILANDGNLPTRLEELRPFDEARTGAPTALTPEVLARYRLVTSGANWNWDYKAPVIEESAELVDAVMDSVFSINAISWRYKGTYSGSQVSEASGQILNRFFSPPVSGHSAPSPARQ